MNRAQVRSVVVTIAVLMAGCGSTAGSDLNGTWESPCYQMAKTSITYTDLQLVGMYLEYSDSACSSTTHVSTWTGSAVVGDAVAGGAQKLDISYSTFRSKPLTAANAMFNNMNQYCGFTDWAANVEKDVLGRNCINFTIPVGAKSLDIYKVDQNTLKFGKNAKIGTNLTEADRPTQLDDTRVFTKR